MTRRQSPVQITALGIIALPDSQERHARQHHEPALRSNKIDGAWSGPESQFPPERFSSTESFCVVIFCSNSYFV